MENVDVLIIGGGPAGLMCGRLLSTTGLSVRVIDAGGAHPDRDALEGVGGAGLYSDGKFSFHPAGTALWKLIPNSMLAQAYGATRDFLASHGVESPRFSDQWVATAAQPGPQTVKSYPSSYVNFSTRLQMIDDLSDSLDVRALSAAVSIAKGQYHEVTLQHAGRLEKVTAKRLVVATGRLWHVGLDHTFATRFRRYELGVRVEQPADEFIFAGHPDLDPKWVYRLSDPDREYRTFCCCRKGMIVHANTKAGILLSGRADGTPTDRSNFGLMVRYLNPVPAPWTNYDKPFTVPAANLAQDPMALARWLGTTASVDLSDALKRVAADAGGRHLDTATLHGPCLEGVGVYPNLADGSLQLADDPDTWILGDATGIFRGLVPALVSGAFAAIDISHGIQSH